MATTETVDVVMPQMGVSVSEGTIVAWRKQPGDWIEYEEPIVDISTETPSPSSCFAASAAVYTIAPHVITETSSPSRWVRALPIGVTYRSSGTSPLIRR